MKISEELVDRLITTLQELSSKWYDDFYGPWGFECPNCREKSEDGKSPPSHTADYEIMQLIQELMKLEESK
jgi:hypothetical protein